MEKLHEVFKTLPNAYLACDENEFEEIVKGAKEFADSRIKQFANEMMDVLVYDIDCEERSDYTLALYMDAIFYYEDEPTEIQNVYFGVMEANSQGHTIPHGQFSDLDVAIKTFLDVASNYENAKVQV